MINEKRLLDTFLEYVQIDSETKNEKAMGERLVQDLKALGFEVQTDRAFGDLSENYEYKCAKQAKNRNESRIRYLERMIRTAKVIKVQEQPDAVGLFDTVTIYNEMLKKEMTVRIVTTLRQDALKGLISKESPVGQALMGHRVGDRVQVAVSPELKYTVEIRSIEKGTDDESLDISSY